MDSKTLITALVALGFQFGPTVVSDFANLIKGNPKGAEETDEAYTARLVKQVEDNTAAIDKQDDDIQGTTTA